MTSLTDLFDAGVPRRRGSSATATRRRVVKHPAARAAGHVAAPAVVAGAQRTWRELFRAHRLRTIVLESLLAALAAGLVVFAGVASTVVLLWAGALAVAMPLAIALAGGYRWRTLGEGVVEGKAVVKATAGVGALLVLLGYAGAVTVPPVVVFGALPVVLAATLGTRLVARRMLVARRARGEGRIRAVVVGAADLARPLVGHSRHAPAVGYEVVGLCSDHPADAETAGIPLLGTTAGLAAVVAEHEVDVVLLVGPQDEMTARRVAWALAGTPASLVVVPSLAEIAGSRVRVRPVGDLWSIQIDVAKRRERVLAKEIFDRLVGVLLLGVSLLVVVPAMIAVRITSPGPALYKQSRVGLNGTPFTMWKIRSMYVDADARRDALLAQSEGNGLLFKMKSDPRITPVGKWLRRLSIDELPQLVNVVKGQMSIVGPRPALAEETDAYEGDERRRLVVKPGLTGLWQVSGRSDLSREDSMRLDLRYVDNWSMSLDATILSRTANAVLGGRGAY